MSGEVDLEQAMARLDGSRVLLVEDSAFNQDVAVAFLERAGVQVDVAATGWEAIRLMDKQGLVYSAVLMDLQLPELDGWQAAAAIRRLHGPATPPIIALTGHDDQAERERCVAAGMVGYLVKPFTPADLYGILARHVGGGAACAKIAPVSREEGGDASFAVLDAQAALARFDGRSDLYLRMLTVFLQKFAGAAVELGLFLNQGEGARAHRLAHTIKGTAGFIGTERLRLAALVLEGQLEHHGAAAQAVATFCQEHAAAVQAIRAYLEAEGAGQSK